MNNDNDIIEWLLLNEDCHASPDDGCKHCEAIQKINEYELTKNQILWNIKPEKRNEIVSFHSVKKNVGGKNKLRNANRENVYTFSVLLA